MVTDVAGMKGRAALTSSAGKLPGLDIVHAHAGGEKPAIAGIPTVFGEKGVAVSRQMNGLSSASAGTNVSLNCFPVIFESCDKHILGRKRDFASRVRHQPHILCERRTCQTTGRAGKEKRIGRNAYGARPAESGSKPAPSRSPGNRTHSDPETEVANGPPIPGYRPSGSDPQGPGFCARPASPKKCAMILRRGLREYLRLTNEVLFQYESSITGPFVLMREKL